MHTCNLKQIVSMKFWFTDSENIQFFIWYMDYISIEYVNFSSIRAGVGLLILLCIIAATCVNHIDIIVRLQFFKKRKKMDFSLFLRQMLIHMIFCSENGWVSSTKNYFEFFFSTIGCLRMSHISYDSFLEKRCPYLK